MLSYGLMNMPVLADQYRFTYISSVQTQDATRKPARNDGWWESRNFVLSSWLDDDGLLLVTWNDLTVQKKLLLNRNNYFEPYNC